ncbi:MAG: tyrosine-protein phosphatase [Lachnospiraceae bacterium]|nr:tyrosine-protein phosphatase [Lachnospiraceae bacterium]
MSKHCLKTALLLFLCACLFFSACGKNKTESTEGSPAESTAEPAAEPTAAPTEATTPAEQVPAVEGLPIQHEPEFGGVYIEITIDDFNKLGFVYGDSVKVTFSNGYTMEDIPYYNGYYVDAGEPLLIAYPGYDYIKACINYGADLWEEGNLYAWDDNKLQAGLTNLFTAADLDEHCTASVYLNEHGKYADIQAARDIHYTDFRKDYPSDEVFANFRNIHPGNIKEGILYRSASPCDNQHKRAPYVDTLMAEAKVRCILNLSDNEVKIERYISADDFNSPYFLSLYEEGNVIPLAMNMNFVSEEFTQKIANGFAAMAEKEGPYLVHCTEGKDRTGFVCMLLEALCGAGYQEIVDDYMLTYDNYYKINEEKDKVKYDIILEKNLIAMLYTVTGDKTVDLTTADLSAYAKDYLKAAGMTDAQIDLLISRLTR